MAEFADDCTPAERKKVNFNPPNDWTYSNDEIDIRRRVQQRWQEFMTPAREQSARRRSHDDRETADKLKKFLGPVPPT